MTIQQATLDGGWIRFHECNSDSAAAGTAATDLISILDTIEVPIVLIQRHSVIACFNKAAADVLGLRPSDVGRASRDIAVLAGWPHQEEQCARVMATGLESRVDFRDGDRWFVVRISPYMKGDRQVVGTVLTFTNVTAFRASIDQAVYERECTKAILNTVADPLLVLSADQRIQSANRAFYTTFGVSRDETQGVPLYALGNGAFGHTQLRTQLTQMLAGGHAFQPIEVDHVFTGQGDRTLIVDAHPLPLPGHPEQRVALVIFQDITARKQAEVAERKRAQEKLRHSEAFLVEAQRLSMTGSFAWRVATDEITWSDQLYRIFELDPERPVTLKQILSRVHHEDVTTLGDIIARTRRDGSDFEYEHRLLMPDQSVKYVHVVAHAMQGKEGGAEYIGAVQDVTERRASEAALNKARSDLTRVVRVTSLGALTASIAHEVNQPLSGIITNASTCLRMLVADPPNVEGARETVRRMIRDGNRASEVITRLRALFARKGVTSEPVDLNDATREVIAMSLSELQSARVVLRTELAEELRAVNGDRVQLQQVILNLLRNAAEAMGEVEDRPRELLVSTEPEGDDAVCLSVRDVGIGIAPDTEDHLFEAFYTTKAQGMGIGLSVSRSIIERHHGRLWATRNEGPGATFAFTLPAEVNTKV